MNRPAPKDIYRHFKGNLYQIVAIAAHSETMEEMVVYQELFGQHKTYVRPLDMFMSRVDRLKYPEVSQEYRFQKLEAEDLSMSEKQTRTSIFDEPAPKGSKTSD